MKSVSEMVLSCLAVNQIRQSPRNCIKIVVNYVTGASGPLSMVVESRLQVTANNHRVVLAFLSASRDR